MNESFWFSWEKDAATVFFWTHFVLFYSPRSGLSTSALPLLSTWVTCHFLIFDMFFNGNRFYPQTTVIISAWFVDRYFDQDLLVTNDLELLCCWNALPIKQCSSTVVNNSSVLQFTDTMVPQCGRALMSYFMNGTFITCSKASAKYWYHINELLYWFNASLRLSPFMADRAKGAQHRES